jgi:hypothetical protein
MLGMGIGPVCGRVYWVTRAAFSAICRTPTRSGGALKLARGLTNKKIINTKKITFKNVEAIVLRTNDFPPLIEQARGLQERVAGFFSKFLFFVKLQYVNLQVKAKAA